MATFSYILCICCDIAEKNGLILLFPAPLGRIICSHSLTFLHDGWMDFLHIGYHDQVPWAAFASKIEFGSVLNLTNYSHFFINFECL